MKFSSFFLVIVSLSVTHAQPTASNEKRIAGFEYIEHVAGKPTTDLPLLIAFHYSSGTPKATLNNYDSLRNPIRIIIPKGNYRKRNGFSYYPVDYYKTDSAAQFASSRIAVDSIAVFVRAIEAKYQKKAIVSGISQGGDIALLLAVYHPELCVASFPFAAVINPGLAKTIIDTSAGKIPIYLHQGEADEIVDVEYTRKKILGLSKKINISLFTYPGVGHDISPDMKATYSGQIDTLTGK